MDSRYVALMDVLGFAEAVSSDGRDEFLGKYRDCLNESFPDSKSADGVEFVAFSDSIILTAKGSLEDSLKALLLTTSSVFGRMLERKIALRGAITCGVVFRSQQKAGSVFVAGKPIVEAYRYEQAQDWIGIMLTPSVVNRLTNQMTGAYEVMRTTPANDMKPILATLPWSGVLRQWPNIPYKTPSGLQDYQQYTLLPCSDYSTVESISTSMTASQTALKEMMELAPTPEAQGKYIKTMKFLEGPQERWDYLKREKARQDEQELQDSWNDDGNDTTS